MTTISIVLLVMSLLSMLGALGLSIYSRKSEYVRAANAAYYICEADDKEYLQMLRMLLDVREVLDLPLELKAHTLR